MQFYQPNQKKTTVQQPVGQPIAGRNTQAGGPVAGQDATSSYKHLSEVPGWGTGQSYIGKSRTAALGTLQNAQSTANPEDYAAMDEMRNYYRTALADLPGNTAAGISSFDTQAQRGLSNMMSQYKNANAGRGTLGSRQYAGGAGDIASRANQDYLTGLIKARSDALDQGGKIQSGLTGIQNQDLSERGFQQAQAQSIADQITQFMNMDMGREAQLENQRYDKEKALDAWKRGMVSSERDKSHEFGMGMAGGGMGGS